jgi:uncharacterized protein (TIGR02145 family)
MNFSCQPLRFLCFIAFLVFVSCSKKESAEPVLSITASEVTDITSATAKCGGSIQFDGGTGVLKRGICWATTNDPDTNRTTKTNDGSGTGNFNSSIAGLSPNTDYYVRAYAVTASGIHYSNQKSFRTAAPLPLAEFNMTGTDSASNITSTSATMVATILSDGGTSITHRGFCYDINNNPNIESSAKTENGTGTGFYSATLNDLSPNTTYYVRGYAITANGTAYGPLRKFKTTTNLFSAGNGVSDANGIIYATILINGKEWMKENLRTTSYSNGKPILSGLTPEGWASTTAGSFIVYDNNEDNAINFGNLYNWYAVADPKGLCPAGWRVPSDTDWENLENTLGGAIVAGGKLKAVSELWTNPNAGATNESGFSVLPGGKCNEQAVFDSLGIYGSFWSSTSYESKSSWTRGFVNGSTRSFRSAQNKASGLAIRCIKN